MEKLITGFTQIGIVVGDMDAYVKKYRESD